ncbi:glycolate oxidase subunit GlcF [Methylocella silvestris]|uniref:Glycolate oxidase iron-sulfur subunit n=1 Tax=Methylocella silvestris TaxID=199596 RepID=A0A2J7TF53_METSI|nr:glycolate oxidase subunit GlcF [Methylocella silvestris]PNG25398.1 glycolate oxidase iron-sulfur subunit [Methylocella silvestris]
MQTHFSLEQLADPRLAVSEAILRKCVHCGFCTATCPTFTLLGDELDSPRGRIYLIKEMLENGRPADSETVKHIDRCLSCLSCMTTCPSGVNYMHLVDEARTRIEETYKRPLADRALRALLGFVLPYPDRFRLALRGAALAAPLAPLLAKFGQTGDRLNAMLRLAPRFLPKRTGFPQASVRPAQKPIARVAILAGCAQKVLRPAINDAAIRLLTRLGVEIVQPPEEGCCGALVHHLGQEHEALAQAKHNIDVWTAEIDRGSLDAILITTSGCGTVIKDYGFMFRLDAAYAAKAAKISELAKDITEFLGGLKLPAPLAAQKPALAYHSACSMQHGQKITSLPKELLKAAGFEVRDIPEGHLCCGSAGTYNILQPKIAEQLRARKIENILKTAPGGIATGNIGCMTQIGAGAGVPVLHTVEWLDYAYGGPKPAEIAAIR